MEEYTSFFLYPLSAAALLTNGLGLIGLLMSSVGVYSMTSFATTQKTREIAIRMAIGAQASSVLWVAIKDGLKMILIGVCGGLLLTIPIVKLLSTLLFGVTPMDALSFVGSALLLCCIVLLACYVPARRVIRIDPAASLRYE
jgi:putative ABC transport system permease protein